MKDEELRAQIDALIRDEIQEGINDYIDETDKDTEVAKEESDELKVKISNDGVDKLIKEYKRIKKSQRSNLGQVRLLDQHGRRINKN
jgi:hypothetical protein